MDEILFRVDKTLLLVVGFALVLIVSGLSSMFRTIDAFRQAADLSSKVEQMETQARGLDENLASIKKANKELFALAKNTIQTQEELLKILTDSYSASGMTILKVSTGTPDKPDLIQINSEGNYRSLQILLNELRQLSHSLEVKHFNVGIDPTKDFLQISLGIRFVKTPTFAYMDGSHQKYAKTATHIRTVQFVPQASQVTPGTPAPPPGSAPVAQPNPSKQPPNSKDTVLERNPFYTPPGAGGTASAPAVNQPPSIGAPDLGKGMPVGSASRSDGLYLTGCVVSAAKRACLFQLADGSSVIFSPGNSIQKDMKILAITDDGVRITTPAGVKTIKVGEQVR